MKPLIGCCSSRLRRRALSSISHIAHGRRVRRRLARDSVQAGDTASPLTMVEAKARKSAFLREAIRHLELTDTVVENARYEELLARPELHEAQHVVSLRAVRIEARVLTSLQAFVAPSGVITLFRGPEGTSNPSLTGSTTRVDFDKSPPRFAAKPLDGADEAADSPRFLVRRHPLAQAVSQRANPGGCST